MAPRRIAIVGAGAIGGWLGVRLAAAGHRVSVLARGLTLAALRAGPWRLEQDGETISAQVIAADDPAALGPQDVVLLTVKGPALPGLAPSLAPMIGAETLIVPAMNGVPWWFMLAGGGEFGPTRLHSVDPDGAIEAALPLDQVIGCVVHASVAAVQPGLARVVGGNGLLLGAPSSPGGARLNALVTMLGGAGFAAEAVADIRQAAWFKLWGNMTINPITALTGATADRVLDDPLVEAFVLRVMEEARALGARIGCPIEESGTARNAVTRRLGSFKPSMLQDVEAGRAPEIDQLLGAPREIAGRLGFPTPDLDALLGLIRLFAARRGLYQELRPA